MSNKNSIDKRFMGVINTLEEKISKWFDSLNEKPLKTGIKTIIVLYLISWLVNWLREDKEDDQE